MKKFVSMVAIFLLILSIGVTPVLADDVDDIYISEEILENLEPDEKMQLEDGSIVFINSEAVRNTATIPITPKSSCRYCYYGSVVANTESKQEYAGMDGGYRVYYIYERIIQQCNNNSCRAVFSTGPWQYKYTRWL